MSGTKGCLDRSFYRTPRQRCRMGSTRTRLLRMTELVPLGTFAVAAGSLGPSKSLKWAWYNFGRRYQKRFYRNGLVYVGSKVKRLTKNARL